MGHQQGPDAGAARRPACPAARTSVWADPEGTATYPKDLVEAIAISTKNGVGHDRPLVVKVAEAREIVGQPIVDAITGKDADRLGRHGQPEFQKFLDDENK